MDPFVTTQWLAERLDDPGVVVVDASWHLPDAGRDARAEFGRGHIPGAVFFDIDAMSDPETDLPHMLPDPADFAQMAGELGIGSGDTIVVYDEVGLFSAPRAWWTLRVMGAANVRILTGGGRKWRAENRPLQTGTSRREPARFEARFDSRPVAAFEDVLSASQSGSAQILDARATSRFTGQAPEPRAGLRSGHIPASRNLPFSNLIADGQLKPHGELEQEFARAGIDLDQPVITSCGSGVTAAVLALALEMVNARDVALYDGSWAEWGKRDDASVASGGL